MPPPIEAEWLDESCRGNPFNYLDNSSSDALCGPWLGPWVKIVSKIFSVAVYTYRMYLLGLNFRRTPT